MCKKCYCKNKLNTDINYKLSAVLRSRLNTAIRGNFKAGSAVDDLSCTISKFKAYLEAKFIEGMTWSNYREWHIDHIQPLTSFDLTNKTQFKNAVHFSNLQPL
jgi:hypothetical protein